MRQTTLSVAREVEPVSVDRLSALIDSVKCQEEDPASGYAEKYGRLQSGVPVLHFMSKCVPERRLRPDIRDRGEFRWPARRVLGPDGSNARAAAAGNAALLQE